MAKADLRRSTDRRREIAAPQRTPTHFLHYETPSLDHVKPRSCPEGRRRLWRNRPPDARGGVVRQTTVRELSQSLDREVRGGRQWIWLLSSRSQQQTRRKVPTIIALGWDRAWFRRVCCVAWTGDRDKPDAWGPRSRDTHSAQDDRGTG
jgi:hypothetical protein